MISSCRSPAIGLQIFLLRVFRGAAVLENELEAQNERRSHSLHWFHAVAVVLVERPVCERAPRRRLCLGGQLGLQAGVRGERRRWLLVDECPWVRSHAQRGATASIEQGNR